MRRDVIFVVVLILFFMQQGCKKEVRNVDDTKGNLKRTETVKESFPDRIAIADSVMNNDSLQSKATRHFVASKQNLKGQKTEPDNYVLAPVEPYFSYGLRHSEQKEENTDVYYTNEGSSVLTDYYNSYSPSNSGYNNYYYYDEYYPVYSDNYFSWYYDNYFNQDYYNDYISPPVWNNKPNRPNRPDRPKPPQKPDQIRPGHPGSTRPPQRPDPELPQRPDSPSIRPLPESVSGKENVNEERERREAETRRQREAQEREVQERQERERRESEARQQRETQERQEQERRDSEARQQRETQERQEREVESSRQGGRR